MGRLLAMVLMGVGLLNVAGCGTRSGDLRAGGTGAYGTVRMIEQVDRRDEARPAARNVSTSNGPAQASGMSFQYTVQMDTGELRTFAGDSQQGFWPGQRVTVMNGTLRRP